MNVGGIASENTHAWENADAIQLRPYARGKHTPWICGRNAIASLRVGKTHALENADAIQLRPYVGGNTRLGYADAMQLRPYARGKHPTSRRVDY